MASEKAQLIDSIQEYFKKSNWKAAVADMEKLFAIDPDPIIRVRMGDAYQKLNQTLDAVKEYVHAADLYAGKGTVVKALAQYKLALRLDPKNRDAQEKMAALHSNKTITEKKPEPTEEGGQKPARSVIPLFAGLSKEEFSDFTKMMVVHIHQPGEAIVKLGDTGQSVFIIATGAVKVWTTNPAGERLDLARLGASDFFGEMSFLTGKPRTATVETISDTVVLEVTEDKLRDLVTRRPRVMEVLQQYSDMRAKEMSNKIQSTQKAPETPVEKASPAKAPDAPTEKTPLPKIPEAAVESVPPPKAPEPPVEKVSPAKATEAAPEKAPQPKAADALDKAKLVDAIQKFVSKSDWKSAIAEMEKLYTIGPDPIIRVRIGDAYQKLGRKAEAVKEYLRAADMYADTGAVVKALAQYKLALRIDPGNKQAQERIEALHSNKTVKESKAEPVEQGAQKPASSVIPLFAGFTQDEFNAFTKVMNVHPLPGGLPIIEQHDTGKSVYIIANGSVKVYTTLLSGERVDLAVLWPGDFFGEMSFLTGKTRTATVETAEDSVILEVTEDQLRDLVAQHPHLLDVLRQYSELRSKGTVEKIQESSK
jgi:CRP-like cAMP-binding protein